MSFCRPWWWPTSHRHIDCIYQLCSGCLFVGPDDCQLLIATWIASTSCVLDVFLSALMIANFSSQHGLHLPVVFWYQNTTGRCNLCVAEKLAIIRAGKKTSRTQLVDTIYVSMRSGNHQGRQKDIAQQKIQACVEVSSWESLLPFDLQYPEACIWPVSTPTCH